MSPKTNLPSISQLITRVPSVGPDKQERLIIKTLEERFGDSIAPLLLLTEQGLHDIDGIGPKTLRYIKEQLEEHQLRARDFCERVDDRAIDLYGEMAMVPIQALYITQENAGDISFSHYGHSPAVSLLTRLDGSMTIGFFKDMNQVQLMSYFTLKGLSMDGLRMKRFTDEIEERLANWGLSLKRQPARVSVN